MQCLIQINKYLIWLTESASWPDVASVEFQNKSPPSQRSISSLPSHQHQTFGMDLNSLRDQVSNLTLYDLKAGVRKVQNGELHLAQ